VISAVLILPVAQKDVGDRAFISMDEANIGVENFPVRLSATGAAPATHYGCHAWVTQEWVTRMQNARDDVATPDADWTRGGTTRTAARTMFASLIISTKPDGEHGGHLEAVCAANGLQRIPPPTRSTRG
jgi:hypothetical protein